MPTKYQRILDLQRRGLNTLYYVPLTSVMTDKKLAPNPEHRGIFEFRAVRTEYERELHPMVIQSIAKYLDVWRIEHTKDGRIRYPLHILQMHEMYLETLQQLLPSSVMAIVSEYFDNNIVVVCGAAEWTGKKLYVDYKEGGYVREVTHDGESKSVTITDSTDTSDMVAYMLFHVLSEQPNGIYEWSYCNTNIGILRQQLLFWDYRRC